MKSHDEIMLLFEFFGITWIYIYICMCVDIYIYIYIYIYMRSFAELKTVR